MNDSTASFYDFVVVGGGTAGLVVAARLSEDPNVTVCVLEAGQDHTYDQEVQVPGLAFKNLARLEIFWPFTSVPQPFANDRVLSHLRGKSLGGSSTVNLVTCVRGHAAEYNAYETLGNKGWNWKTLLPYLKKSETYTVTPEDRAKFGVELNTDLHGTEGPISRTFPKRTPGLSDYLETMKSLGFSYNKDPSNGDNSGVFVGQFSIHPKDAVRTFSASGYFKPAEKRENLHVLTGAYVTKVILGSDKRENGLVSAEGVEYTKGGKTSKVLAKREVILSAGAYQSPQLLELSGIGDPKILETHGLPCHIDLPGVGCNYQDHFWCPVIAETTSDFETHEVLSDPARVAQEWELYEKTKSGSFSTNGGGTGFTLLPCTSFMDKDKFEDLVAEASKLHPAKYEKVANVRKEFLDGGKVPFLEVVFVAGSLNPQTSEPGKKYVSCLVSPQHQFSHGTVHIASADPSAPPNIDPRLFDNKVDMKVMLEGLKLARRIFGSGKFKGTTKDVVVGLSSDEELEKFIRETAQTVYHPTGTASMLPREDGGVVDADLRVYGTANLRVVDASVMMMPVSGHPMMTIYAIAEKAADMIKSSYA